MRAKEGDAYPLGALPVGTKVHCVEQSPGVTFHKVRAAGTFGTIIVRTPRFDLSQYLKRFISIKTVCISRLFQNLAKIRWTRGHFGYTKT